MSFSLQSSPQESADQTPAGGHSFTGSFPSLLLQQQLLLLNRAHSQDALLVQMTAKSPTLCFPIRKWTIFLPCFILPSSRRMNLLSPFLELPQKGEESGARDIGLFLDVLFTSLFKNTFSQLYLWIPNQVWLRSLKPLREAFNSKFTISTA